MNQAVFISYASRDKEIADAVCRALEENGVRCWIAPRDVLPGMEYASSIIDALNSCQVFLVIFSETSNTSPQVAREVERAISKNRVVLTFRIDNTPLSKAMEYYLSDRHWMDASSGKFTQHLGNLVKAVRALEAAMPPASTEDNSVQRRSSEVKAAEEQRQLEALLTKADAAIKSARWDEASEFLKKALAIKPDKTIEATLAEVSSQHRTASLIDLKTRAQGLARAGQFDEALDAWNEYLALKPDDHEDVERILQDLRKTAKIARDYEKSQAAISRKYYDRAIGLLQGIIAQEPAYKDSPRLLSEAIQAKKSIPAWRRHWVFEVTGAVAIILMGVFLGPKLWASISTPPESTPEPAKTDSSTTDFPTVTALQKAPSTAEARYPVPALPANLVSLEPILAYVKSTSPDIADDFSKANKYWGQFPAGVTTDGGVLRMTLQAGTPTEKTWLNIPSSNIMNFGLEFDFYYEGGGEDTTLNIYFGSTGDGSGTNCNIGIYLATGDWSIELTDSSIGTSGKLGEPLIGKWYHLQMVLYKGQVVEFLNGKLLGHVEGLGSYSGDNIGIVAVTTGRATIQLDNLKFWDLDKTPTLP